MRKVVRHGRKVVRKVIKGGKKVIKKVKKIFRSSSLKHFYFSYLTYTLRSYDETACNNFGSGKVAITQCCLNKAVVQVVHWLCL